MKTSNPRLFPKYSLSSTSSSKSSRKSSSKSSSKICQVKVAAKDKIDVIDGAWEEREQYESQVRDYDIGRGITFWGQRNWLKRGKFNDHPDLLPYGNLILAEKDSCWSQKIEKTACPLPNWARGQATEFFHEEAEELPIEVMKAVNTK